MLDIKIKKSSMNLPWDKIAAEHIYIKQLFLKNLIQMRLWHCIQQTEENAFAIYLNINGTKQSIFTSTAAIKALTRPVPVSMDPRRVSPILQEINCAPGATPFSKGSC